MKTREQITVSQSLPADWHDRAAPVLREQAAAKAAALGLRICDDGTENVSAIWLKDAGTLGAQKLAECSQSEADTVRVTLTAWAEPK